MCCIDIINGGTECADYGTSIILIDCGVGDGNMGDDIVDRDGKGFSIG